MRKMIPDPGTRGTEADDGCLHRVTEARREMGDRGTKARAQREWNSESGLPGLQLTKDIWGGGFQKRNLDGLRTWDMLVHHQVENEPSRPRSREGTDIGHTGTSASEARGLAVHADDERPVFGVMIREGITDSGQDPPRVDLPETQDPQPDDGAVLHHFAVRASCACGAASHQPSYLTPPSLRSHLLHQGLP